jgi:hypothetical protein
MMPNGTKETIHNDTSRPQSTNVSIKNALLKEGTHSDLKLLLSGEIQGYLNAPAGSRFEKNSFFSYTSDTIVEKYTSTIIIDDYSGTLDGLIAFLAIQAIGSKKTCVPVTCLSEAVIICSLRRYDDEEGEYVWTADAEYPTLDLMAQIIEQAQHCIVMSTTEVPLEPKIVDKPDTTQDKAIRQIKTVQAHTKKWHELSWTTCPDISTDLSTEVEYRLSLCGRDPNMRLKVLRWRDDAHKYYGSFEYKTNQTPKWRQSR